MSVCQSGEAEEDSGSEEVSATSAVRELYKQKPVSKVVRVLTVLAYLLSVSLAAILLSVYYVCVWKSPELPPLNETDPAASRLTAPRASEAKYVSTRSHGTAAAGGGDSGVKAPVAPTPIPVTNSFENASTSPAPAVESTTDFASNSSTPTSSEPPHTTSYPSIDPLNATTTSVT